MACPLVWCYAPNSDLTGWNPPYICEDECPTLEDAHRHARVLREHYPGHLFAVTYGERPKSARPVLPGEQLPPLPPFKNSNVSLPKFSS